MVVNIERDFLSPAVRAFPLGSFKHVKPPLLPFRVFDLFSESQFRHLHFRYARRRGHRQDGPEDRLFGSYPSRA